VFKEIREHVDLLEKGRREYYIIKSEISSLEIREKKKTEKIIEYKKELEIIERKYNQVFSEIKHEKFLDRANSLKEKTKIEINILKETSMNLEKEILEIEKINAVLKGY
jgi:hypothetical protein